MAVDDCGNIINPMIVDGQIHGGLTMGFAPSLYEEITYDELGNNLAGTFMDYLLPTAVETPAWETDKTITPSPHHPIGAKGVGESATVGAPPAIANAVVDALWHLGVRNIDIPMTPQKIWRDPPREGGDAHSERPRCGPARAGRRARARRPAVRRGHGRGRRAADLGAARGAAASSIRTARSRAGSAAAAPSPWSSARRCARSPTASRGCSGSRKTGRPRAAGATASSRRS